MEYFPVQPAEEYGPGPEPGLGEPPGGTAEQIELLLRDAGKGSIAKTWAALLPDLSSTTLEAALARSVVNKNVGVASLLLSHIRDLGLWDPCDGAHGSLDSPDPTMAAVVRRFARDGGLERVGGWGEWGPQQLLKAGRYNLAETVQALVDCGCSLEQMSPAQVLDFVTNSPLDICERAGARQALAAADGEGRTPCHVFAAERWPQAEQARHLVAAGASLTAVDSRGQTPLHVYARNLRSGFASHPAALMAPRSGGMAAGMAAVAGALASFECVGMADNEGQTPSDIAGAGLLFPVVAELARFGGRGSEQVMESALAWAAAQAHRCGSAEAHEIVAVLRLCGAGGGEVKPEHASMLSAAPSELLMRYACRFYSRALLLRVLSGLSVGELAAHAAHGGARRAQMATLLLCLSRRGLSHNLLEMICKCVLVVQQHECYAELLG